MPATAQSSGHTGTHAVRFRSMFNGSRPEFVPMTNGAACLQSGTCAMPSEFRRVSHAECVRVQVQ